MDFIQSNKGDVVEGRKLGVWLICRVLQVAPSTYYAAKYRAPWARALSDAVLSGELYSLWEKNRKVYGGRKLWKAAKRSGIDIGLDQTARLMRSLGIEGVKRSRRVKTTRPDPSAKRHPDLMKRVFSSTASNQLWITGLMFVTTWEGVGYVYFITETYSRNIVGWWVVFHMKREDTLTSSRWRDGPGATTYLVCGGTRMGAANSRQFDMATVSLRLAQPPIGSAGDSFDTALAETGNGDYEAGFVRGPDRSGPW